MPGIASAATAVVIAPRRRRDPTIRVGAGGIMLPNHSPLVIAEQFGTLESLYPGPHRSRASGARPGSDGLTARALRRSSLADAADAFPQDVVELMAYFRGRAGPAGARGAGRGPRGADLDPRLEPVRRAARRRARPAVTRSPRTSRPTQMMQAIEIYRAQFRPSEQLDRPVRDARVQRLRRRHRRRGEAAVHVAAAGVRQPAARAARPAAAAGRWLRRAADARRARDDRAGAVVHRGRLARRPCAAASRRSSPAPAPTS